MRLIDADELIKDRVENDPVRIAAMCEPTAYDVDKVVEQLGESKEIYSICGGALHVYAVRVDKAINIVKGACPPDQETDIQQYRAIGTVEDCRAAMEKQKAKAPDIWGDGYDGDGNMIYDMYDCPNCGESYEIECDHYKYCPNCGQAIDRSSLK